MNTSHCHGVAHEITDQIYKDVKVFIGLGGVLQERYLESKIKKLGDNNVKNDNANAAQTKTNPDFLKKRGQKQLKSMTKKYSDKGFT